MKYIDLLNIRVDVINGLMQKRIPMRIKFPLMNNIDLMEECRNKWNTMYEELIKRYCDTDENGNLIIVDNRYSIPDDKYQEFKKEFDSVSNMHACDVKTVDAEWLESDYDEYRFDILTIDEINSLKFMIE